MSISTSINVKKLKDTILGQARDDATLDFNNNWPLEYLNRTATTEQAIAALSNALHITPSTLNDVLLQKLIPNDPELAPLVEFLRDRVNHTGTQLLSTISDAGTAAALSAGSANGAATLDANAKIPLVQLPDSVLGQVKFKVLWNAATNTPALPAAPTASGDYYIVTAAGAQFGLSFEVGDWLIANGTAWGKVDNTDAVQSVQGRTGAVIISKSDVGLSAVDNVSAAAMRDRSTHTGTQPLSTISDAGAAASKGVTGAGLLMAEGFCGLGDRPVNVDSNLTYGLTHSGFFSATGLSSTMLGGYPVFITAAPPTSGYGLAIAAPALGEDFVAAKYNVGAGGVITDTYAVTLAHNGNTIFLGTTPAQARNTLQLGDMSTRSLVVSIVAPSAPQIAAMAEGDLWGVY